MGMTEKKYFQEVHYYDDYYKKGYPAEALVCHLTILPSALLTGYNEPPPRLVDIGEEKLFLLRRERSPAAPLTHGTWTCGHQEE